MLRFEVRNHSLFVIEFDKIGLKDLIKSIVELPKRQILEIIDDGKIKFLKIIEIKVEGYHGNFFRKEKELLIEMTKEDIEDFLDLLTEYEKTDKYAAHELLEVKFKKRTESIIISYVTTEYLSYLSKIVERWKNVVY